jgi:phytanoyl-CoA hydroxylase
MELSSQELLKFQRDGFLLLKGFVSSVRCDAIKALATEHLEQKIPPIESELEYAGKSKEERKVIGDGHAEEKESVVTIRRLRQVYGREPLFKAWMEDKEIRSILQQVLGDTPVITLAHHNSIMTKMPYTSTQTRWHQDFRYWHFSNDNLVSVWLALDSEDEYNGALEFIPGSHKMQFDPSQFDGKEYFLESGENEEIIKRKASFKLHKGDVVLFHCKTLHRANKNSTDVPKIAFVYTVKGVETEAKRGTRSAMFDEVVLGIE